MSQFILNFTSRSENIRYFVAFHKLSHQSQQLGSEDQIHQTQKARSYSEGTAVVEDPGNSNNHPQNIHQREAKGQMAQRQLLHSNPRAKSNDSQVSLWPPQSVSLVLH